MNTFLTSRPGLEHVIFVHASATLSNAAKMVSGGLSINSFAVCKPNLPCRANAAPPWIYLGIHQTATYFPVLVTTSGKWIFNAFWADEPKACSSLNGNKGGPKIGFDERSYR